MSSNIVLIAESLSADLSQLALPLYEYKVRAGQSQFPSPAQDYELAELDLNRYLIRNPPATFFAKATGFSMIGAGIFPDSILIVNKSLEPKSGRIVIALYEGELMVKKLYKRAGIIKLLSDTTDTSQPYPPILLKEGQELIIWGVVEHVITPTI